MEATLFCLLYSLSY